MCEFKARKTHNSLIPHSSNFLMPYNFFALYWLLTLHHGPIPVTLCLTLLLMLTHMHNK
jgi:hypothetical protein